MRLKYNKLIRDRIPEIVKKAGWRTTTKTLRKTAFLGALKRKVSEEAEELIRAKTKKGTIEEIVDIQELIDTLIPEFGSSKTELRKLQALKRKKRGGFKKGLFLIKQEKQANPRRANVLEKLYGELREKHGPPKGQWSLWCKRPKTEREREEIVIGAVLAQRTNWNNADAALDNLKKEEAGSLKGLLRIGPKKLRDAIKPSGFYKTKSRRLIGLAGFILKEYGGLAAMKRSARRELRESLLELKGIGPETADSILLYALDKPVFVIDEYTRRLAEKRSLIRDRAYSSLQQFFESNLRKDFRLYQDFHALIVIEGKKRTGRNRDFLIE